MELGWDKRRETYVSLPDPPYCVQQVHHRIRIDFHKLFIKISGNVAKQEFELEKALMSPFVYIPNDQEE